MSCVPRNGYVPLHPDPDKVLAGTNLSIFPNAGFPVVAGVPAVQNPEMDTWEDGDGTPITEDPFPYMTLT